MLRLRPTALGARAPATSNWPTASTHSLALKARRAKSNASAAALISSAVGSFCAKACGVTASSPATIAVHRARFMAGSTLLVEWYARGLRAVNRLHRVRFGREDSTIAKVGECAQEVSSFR